MAGQLQPIGVLSDYTLIWGERRLRAALLKKEITHLLAVVFDREVSESEFLLMRATENFQRADLTDNEKWLTCKELREANPRVAVAGPGRPSAPVAGDDHQAAVAREMLGCVAGGPGCRPRLDR